MGCTVTLCYVVTLMLTALPVWCQPPDRPTSIVIVGSERMVPLARKLAERFMKVHPEVKIEVQGGGSNLGIFKLTKGEANTGSGSDLMTDCASNDPYKRGFCTGYVADVDHIFSTLMERKKISRHYCPGKDVTLGELKRVWKKWLAKHPEKLTVPADVTLIIAFKDAFACSTE